jgi:hypothetical protein
LRQGVKQFVQRDWFRCCQALAEIVSLEQLGDSYSCRKANPTFSAQIA